MLRAAPPSTRERPGEEEGEVEVEVAVPTPGANAGSGSPSTSAPTTRAARVPPRPLFMLSWDKSRIKKTDVVRLYERSRGTLVVVPWWYSVCRSLVVG